MVPMLRAARGTKVRRVQSQAGMEETSKSQSRKSLSQVSQRRMIEGDMMPR